MVATTEEAKARKLERDRLAARARRAARRTEGTTVAPVAPASSRRTTASTGLLTETATTPARGSNSIALPPETPDLLARWDELIAASPEPLNVSDSGGSEPYRIEAARGFELIGLPRRGHDLYGHQLRVVDVLNASSDEFGTPLHRFVAALIARRAGKTASILATLLGRMDSRPGYRVAMTLATAGNMAQKVYLRDVVIPLETLFPDKATRPFTINRSAGNPHVRWHNGSHFAVIPPTSAAFRSERFNAVWIDEAGEATADQSEDLLAGLLATGDTEPDFQVIISGTAPSFRRGNLLWDNLVDAREGKKGNGLIEYAAPPETTVEDIDDWEKARPIVAAAHPGFGHLSPETGIESNYEKLSSIPNGLTRFMREYLSIAGDVGGSTGLFKPEKIASLELDDDKLPGPPERFALAVAVRPNQSAAAIVAAWRVEDGSARVLVLDSREGVSWLAPRALELARKYRVPIVYDNLGAVLVEVEKMTRSSPRPRLEPQTSRQAYTAAALLVDQINDGHLWHWGQDALVSALTLVVRRKVGEKQFALGAASPDDDITCAEAAAYALAYFDRMPAKRRIPNMVDV